MLTGLLIFVFKFIRPNSVTINDHNLKEFLESTKVLGDQPYVEPYPIPVVQIVSPTVLFKTYQRELRM
jgi:hypothetical protein